MTRTVGIMLSPSPSPSTAADETGSVSAVARAIAVVRASGLPHRTDAMFTTIEEDECMAVVKECCDVLAEPHRVGLVLRPTSGRVQQSTARWSGSRRPSRSCPTDLPGQSRRAHGAAGAHGGLTTRHHLCGGRDLPPRQRQSQHRRSVVDAGSSCHRPDDVEQNAPSPHLPNARSGSRLGGPCPLRIEIVNGSSRQSTSTATEEIP